jgi:glycine/D-amino acid oxidase-like deaminating enzyme
MHLPAPSIWEKESFYRHRDILIVGGGLAGLWSAYYLKKKKPRLTIAILERGIIPTGASTRNAGFACFGSVTELIADAKNMGKQKMEEVVAMRFEGLQKTIELFPKNEIGLEKLGGYELIASTQYPTIQLLKNDIAWMNKSLEKATGLKNNYRLADKKMNRFGFANIQHLVESRAEAQLHSGKLVQALQQKIQAMGVGIFTNCEATSIENNRNGIVVTTAQGASFSSNQLLLCTNAFSRTLFPKIKISPARGQILVTEPLQKLPFKGCFHFDEGYYYFRNLGNRILLGGARNKDFNSETSDTFITTPVIQAELERFLKNVILPEQPYKIQYRWAGIMGMGNEKTPLIKEIQKNIFCATRMGGIGVAIAPIVAQQATKLLMQ